MEFAGRFNIQFEKEFHGKIFRDSEIAFVYVYTKPVDETKLVLQEEEVDAVEWFDIEEIIEECEKHNQKFCVPREGLRTAYDYYCGNDVEWVKL